MASLDQPVAANAYLRATETANYVRDQLPDSLKHPEVAIICGSGLGGLADTIEAEPKTALDYADIPHFPQSTGTLNMIIVVARKGRSKRWTRLFDCVEFRFHSWIFWCGFG